MGVGSVNSPPWPMQEGINEVIATTPGNAAPMGIICRNGKLMMAVFRTSHTSQQIEQTGMIVANIVHDPVLFVRAAFTDLTPDEYTEELASGKKVYRLSTSLSWIAYHAVIEQKTDQKLLVRLEPVRTELAQTPVIPINRGLNSVIEATVHSTRYILTRDPALKSLIDHHMDLIRRCGGERELEALSLLLDYIR